MELKPGLGYNTDQIQFIFSLIGSGPMLFCWFSGLCISMSYTQVDPSRVDPISWCVIIATGKDVVVEVRWRM